MELPLGGYSPCQDSQLGKRWVQILPPLLGQALLCSEQPAQLYMAALDITPEVEKCQVLKVGSTSDIFIICTLKM